MVVEHNNINFPNTTFKENVIDQIEIVIVVIYETSIVD